jgi:ribosomal 30S subunit maturation factor RimM
MNKLIIASAAGALMLGISAPAFAQATPADCDNLFQRADVNKDGSLQADEAKVFIDAMNKAQVKPQDASMIKKDEFLAACQKNAFVDIKPETVGTAAATQPATTDQSQTSTATKTEQPATTTATTEQAQTGTATTEQPATKTTEQAQTGTATTEQPATTTTEQTAATQSTTTEQTTTTQPTEQALAAPEGFLASNIIGATVYSQDDQSIGDINDIILSPQGEPSQVIVGVGGFLGLGEKDVVLDMSKLKIAATESGKVKIVVQTTPEALKNMPAFTKKQ